jgi:hypothetical protein
MLVAFLCSRVRAADLTFSGSAFFPPRLVGVNDTINVTFPSNNSQGVFVWRSNSPDVSVQLTVVSANGTIYSIGLSASSGVRVTGRGAVLRVDSSVTMQIWVLPNGLCPGLLVVYSSPASFNDDLRLVELASNLCLFFTDPVSLHLMIEWNSEIYFYQPPDLRSPAGRCKGSCVADFHYASFAVIKQIRSASRLTLEGTTRSAPDAQCARDFLPLIVRAKVRILDIASEGGNLFSCTQTVQTGYIGHVATIAFAFALLITATIVVFVGWWSRIRARIRGFAEALPEVDESRAETDEQLPQFAEVASDES